MTASSVSQATQALTISRAITGGTQRAAGKMALPDGTGPSRDASAIFNPVAQGHKGYGRGRAKAAGSSS